MYKPKHFQLYELISKLFYQTIGITEYQKWMVFDDRILRAADRLREEYGPMVCNDWYWGGKNQWRGFRGPECTIGVQHSQHRYGRALDLIPVKAHAPQIREDIITLEIFEINCIEDNVSWLHIDCRNNTGKIKVVTP